jgi:hypothetical protein
MELRIASPCSADWDRMQGDDRVRYCPECKLNVYNFDAMDSGEIESLARNREGRLCARFYARPDGTLLTQNCPVGFRARVRRISRAAGAIFSTATAVMSATFAAAQTAVATSQSAPSKRSDAALSLEVIDQSGAVIANAKVSLISEKKTFHEGKTDSKGEVLIPDLVPGTYSVVIAATNFSTYRAQVDVQSAQTMRVVAKLDLGVIMGDVVEVPGPVPNRPILEDFPRLLW